MTDSSHIIQSAKMISRIFTILEPRGVSQTNIDHETLEIKSSDKDDMILFGDTMMWLSKEGLIHHKFSQRRHSFRECTLSAKAYGILGYGIDFDGESITMQQASKRIEARGVSAASAGDFMGGLAGGFYKSISGG